MRDPFTAKSNDYGLIKEYFERSKRMKEDKKWLQDNKDKVLQAMQGRDKADFDGIRVTVSIPNTSKFDLDKIYNYLNSYSPALLKECTKQVIDEDKLSQLIENGAIDLTELQEVAWVESVGTPRITLKQVDSDD